MSPRRYPISFDLRLEDPPLASSELERERRACDAAIVLLINYRSSGARAVDIVSRDGRTGECVPDAELYECWLLMASKLASSPTLAPVKREIAEAVRYSVEQDARLADTITGKGD